MRTRNGPTHDRSLRSRTRRILTLAALVSLLTLCVALAGLVYRPAWYVPRSIDYHRLSEDKRAQVRLENSISTALNAGRAAEATLTQDLLNRWIAARHELWPGEPPSLKPFSRPMIVLEGGNRIRLAACVEYAGVRCVLSAGFRVELDGRAIQIVPEAVRVGALPAPSLLVEDALQNLIDASGGAPIQLVSHRIVLRNEWVWPNGKRLFRVADLSISDGELHAVLEPLE